MYNSSLSVKFDIISCREVHEMFLEISNLVTQQGELVDNIEHVTI